MRLLRVPVVAMLLGCVWLFMGYSRYRASATPPTPTVCASPLLSELDHVVLHECVVTDVLRDSDGFWIVLAAPGASSPSVVARVRAIALEDVVPIATDYLRGGGMDVARTHRDARDARLSGFPELAGVGLVGEWREAEDSPIDATTGIYLFFGVAFIAADLARMGTWLLGRIRGPRRR